ncbi:hypothetical protein J4Q44_G00211990 [Coregonus suidteri]|uniref:Uncharacterized protein n=1 Tax=Coregonus suidteri TaxID=861788 RepID=A0AAN8LD75_9TELE
MINRGSGAGPRRHIKNNTASTGLTATSCGGPPLQMKIILRGVLLSQIAWSAATLLWTYDSWLGQFHHYHSSSLPVKVKTEPVNNSETDYHRRQHWTAMQAKESSFIQC